MKPDWEYYLYSFKDDDRERLIEFLNKKRDRAISIGVQNYEQSEGKIAIRLKAYACPILNTDEDCFYLTSFVDVEKSTNERS